ncbi:MAG: phosphoribosylformylglycinamidine cyclo-ligase, partial [Chloroflexota bacterium]
GTRSLGRPGFFAGVYEQSPDDQTLLAASADGVGTKLALARGAGRFRGVGMDLVNHCVNDILTTGARPMFFLDYIGIGHADRDDVAEIAEGMAAACRDAGCALLGGETAIMPGLYSGDDLDVVGFIVGSVERDALLTGEDTRPGDVLIGVPSSGPHTNGYSLIRKVFGTDENPSVLHEDQWRPDIGRPLGDALLEPHRSYLNDLQPVLGELKGMAHITGGGINENLPRSLPDGVAADVRLGSWEIPPLFTVIQQHGRVSQEEMFRVFNMGVGMVLIADAERAGDVIKRVPGSWKLGTVTEHRGGPRVRLV